MPPFYCLPLPAHSSTNQLSSGLPPLKVTAWIADPQLAANVTCSDVAARLAQPSTAHPCGRIVRIEACSKGVAALIGSTYGGCAKDESGATGALISGGVGASAGEARRVGAADEGGKSLVGLIAGSVIGAIVCLILLLLVIMFVARRRKVRTSIRGQHSRGGMCTFSVGWGHGFQQVSGYEFQGMHV